MSKLRLLFIGIQLVITVTITIIFMYIFKKDIRKVRIIWGKIQLKLLGIKLEIIGQIDNDADMMIMNHQSLIDIIIFEAIIPRNTAWVAKKEIANIPWFGKVLTVPDMIIIQRESKSSLVKLIKDSKNRLDDNRPLAIFPEGTRTDGKKLRKFKAGAKIVANKYNLKVQPFVIINSNKLMQKSGTVKIICLDTVQASKTSSWYEDTEILMSNTLKDELK